MTRSFRTPVALAVMACCLPLANAQSAQTAPAAASAQALAAAASGVEQLERVVVESSADASKNGLSPAFAGGQVARGGRAGILGTKDNLDTPFSITAYTSDLIQDTQAKGVADVLQNDPSVRSARGYGNFQEVYFIRGFILASDDIAYNGLFGLMPRQYIASDLFERVELLRGASAFLLGASPGGGGIGGNLNLLPKRAQNQDLNRVTIGYGSGGELSESADVSRRFGPDKDAGIRVNVAHRDGGTAVDAEGDKLDLVSVGLDWHRRDVRLSADIGYQNNELSRTRPSITLGTGVTALPAVPKADVNFAQPWTYSNERDVFGTLRGEVDLSADTTVWAALGSHNDKEANSLSNFTLTNAATGASNTTRFDNTYRVQTNTGEMGVRGKLNTGGVMNEWVLSASAFQEDDRAAYAWDYFNAQSTNIYTPVYSPLEPFSSSAFLGNNLADPGLTGRTQLHSVVASDTLHLLNDKLLLTVGARAQHMRVESFAYGTGTEAAPYDKNRLSPSLAAVYKISKGLSVYANDIQGLSQGDSYTSSVNGALVTLAPYVSKQKEVGIKYEADRTGYGLALFTTDKPRSVSNTTVSQGFDRHQGAEFTVFGEAMPGLKILGGLTLLDTRQTNTGDPTTEGKRTLGVPKEQANIGLDWAVTGVEGLSLNSRVLYTGGVCADSANTLAVPNWTRLDIGSAYVMDVGSQQLTLRARVDNVANRKYWSSAGGYPNQGYLVVGAPRTVSLSVSTDF